MRVLVTGGAGYIGSVVAEELLQAGHQVIVFDNLSRGHRQAVPKNAELVVGDTADRACLDQLLRSHAIDPVMHFAALIEAGESMKADKLAKTYQVESGKHFRLKDFDPADTGHWRSKESATEALQQGDRKSV